MESDSAIRKLITAVHKVEDFFAGFVLLVLVVFSLVQLLLKSVFTEITLWGRPFTIYPLKWIHDVIGPGFSWGDSFQRGLVLWLAVLGAMVATRHDRHINVEIGSKFMPIKYKTEVRIFTDAFAAVVCGFVAYTGFMLVHNDMESGSIAFAKVPAWVMESIIPFGFSVISLRYLRYFVLHVLQTMGVIPIPTEDKRLPHGGGIL